MEKKRISDERLAELIRAAALRREVPVGLETRVMAQVILRDRRRRERRAIAAMACYCAVAVAAVMVVAFVCRRGRCRSWRFWREPLRRWWSPAATGRRKFCTGCNLLRLKLSNR